MAYGNSHYDDVQPESNPYDLTRPNTAVDESAAVSNVSDFYEITDREANRRRRGCFLWLTVFLSLLLCLGVGLLIIIATVALFNQSDQFSAATAVARASIAPTQGFEQRNQLAIESVAVGATRIAISENTATREFAETLSAGELAESSRTTTVEAAAVTRTTIPRDGSDSLAVSTNTDVSERENSEEDRVLEGSFEVSLTPALAIENDVTHTHTAPAEEMKGTQTAVAELIDTTSSVPNETIAQSTATQTPFIRSENDVRVEQNTIIQTPAVTGTRSPLNAAVANAQLTLTQYASDLEARVTATGTNLTPNPSENSVESYTRADENDTPPIDTEAPSYAIEDRKDEDANTIVIDTDTLSVPNGRDMADNAPPFAATDDGLQTGFEEQNQSDETIDHTIAVNHEENKDTGIVEPAPVVDDEPRDITPSASNEDGLILDETNIVGSQNIPRIIHERDPGSDTADDDGNKFEETIIAYSVDDIDNTLPQKSDSPPIDLFGDDAAFDHIVVEHVNPDLFTRDTSAQFELLPETGLFDSLPNNTGLLSIFLTIAILSGLIIVSRKLRK